MKILLRIWDLFFFEGSIVLFQITLSMLKMKEPHLKELENAAQIFNALSDIPGYIDDVDKLLEVVFIHFLYVTFLLDTFVDINSVNQFIK